MRSIQLSRLLPAIRQEFSHIQDHRKIDASGHAYPMTNVLMAGLAMMFLQDPSLLEFQRRLKERRGSCNLDTIFGVKKIPADSQFRRILDPIDPKALQNAFRPCIQGLQKTTLWPKYRVLDGRYAVLIDGFEFFRSEKCECKHCLEFHHKDGRVEYVHRCLAATLAHPTAKKPIPLLLEEIRKEDGTKKQDCEFNAARRLIPDLAKQHPHLKMIIVGDDLFSKVPQIVEIQGVGMNYILVAKPTDHVSLEKNLAKIRLCGGVERMEVTTPEGKHLVYEWAHDVELTANSELKTNWFCYSEISNKGKQLYYNSWITDIKPNRRNIKELAEVGRHRWQIENQAFNVLKNHGHHLEHNFGHGEKHLAFIFIILNFLGYMLHQLICLSDHLFQAAQEWVGTSYRLWDEIRVLLKFLIWSSWEALLKHILDWDEEKVLDSG